MPDTKLVCPECGVPMLGRNPYAHALSHWDEYLDPAKSSPEARKRQAKCIGGGVTEQEYLKSHQEG